MALSDVWFLYGLTTLEELLEEVHGEHPKLQDTVSLVFEGPGSVLEHALCELDEDGANHAYDSALFARYSPLYGIEG